MQLLQYTASLPGGSGQCNSYNTMPHCLRAGGSAAPAMHYLTFWGQWAVRLLQIAALPAGGSGQSDSCNTLPHGLGAVGSATPAIRCLTAQGQGAVQLLQYSASLPGGSGQCISCNALPHCLGAVGSVTPAIYCLTGSGQRAVGLLQYTLPAWGQWAVGLPQCTASLPGGSGQCNSYNTPPHCVGAVGSATPAIRCLTAWGECTANCPQTMR